MPNNPFTNTKRGRENILQNMKYRQQNGGDSPHLREEINNEKKRIERLKQQEQDWNKKHR